MTQTLDNKDLRREMKGRMEETPGNKAVMGIVSHSVGPSKIITANAISLHPNSSAREALAHFKDAAQRDWSGRTPL